MKKFILAGAAIFSVTVAQAQMAFDAYRLTQPDMKGTARYMGMAGAFGALGGDLSTLSHNPAGIGVYRNSDVGFTLDLDLQNSESNFNGFKTGVDQTKFLLNNIGFVWTLKLNSSSVPNVNIGFTYNKDASFNRRYSGAIGLTNSLSNYLAAVTTQGGYQQGQLLGDEYNNYQPYNPPDANDAAPWASILGYDGYLFSWTGYTPQDTPYYQGQWSSGTTGTGYFDVRESGGIDSYNIALGGNISNVVYWGMDFDITHLNYTLTPQWSERLEGAVVENADGYLRKTSSLWNLSNFYNCSGTGFNYKLGFIVKPIHELRLGFAFETPTWYGLTETYDASLSFNYGNGEQTGTVETNDGLLGYNDINFRTPWKINASAAAVLFDRLILSAEYEWTQYKKMKYSMPSPWGGDYWYDDPWYDDPWYDYPWYYNNASGLDPYISSGDPFYYNNLSIQETLCNTNTLRLGAEFRVIPQVSVRAGYSYVSSPVNSKMKTSSAMVETAGTIPNYRVDNSTNYLTCGVGFRMKSFYIDLAYVYKHMSSEYHAFSSWFNTTDIRYYQENTKLENMPLYPNIPTQSSSLSLNNSQIVLTAGFKF